MHPDKIMHNPVDLQPFLESSGVLGIHIGAAAIGSTTSPQRGMEGFQMIGMNLCSGKRLFGVGMLWIGPTALKLRYDLIASYRTGKTRMAASYSSATSDNANAR